MTRRRRKDFIIIRCKERDFICPHCHTLLPHEDCREIYDAQKDQFISLLTTSEYMELIGVYSLGNGEIDFVIVPQINPEAIVAIGDIVDWSYVKHISFLSANPWQGFTFANRITQASAFLLDIFLSKDNRQSLVGDLEEEYRTRIIPKYGWRRATVWYLIQVIKSILPIVWSVIVRIIMISIIWKKSL